MNITTIVSNLIEAQRTLLDVQDQALATSVDYIEDLNVEIDELIEEVAQHEDILIQSARYVGQMRELLSKLGVTVETDNTTGLPVLVIDRDSFAASAAVVATVE